MRGRCRDEQQVHYSYILEFDLPPFGMTQVIAPYPSLGFRFHTCYGFQNLPPHNASPFIMDPSINSSLDYAESSITNFSQLIASFVIEYTNQKPYISIFNLDKQFTLPKYSGQMNRELLDSWICILTENFQTLPNITRAQCLLLTIDRLEGVDHAWW